MKLIKSIVRPNMVDNIKEALGKLTAAQAEMVEQLQRDDRQVLRLLAQ